MTRLLPDATVERLVAYAEDRLDPRDRIAFEIEMSEDPDLAAAYDSWTGMEEVERRVLERRSKPGRLLAWPLAAAAILVAAVGAAVFVLGPGPADRPPRMEVALLETAPTREGYDRLLGLPDGLRPAGQGTRDADADAGGEPVEARAYAEVVRAAERERTERAYGEGSGSVTARTFVVRLRPAEDVSALVVARDPSGGLRRLFPRGDASSRLAGGATHTLPSDTVTVRELPGADAFVEYHEGWAVPPGAEIVVLLAWRGAELEPDLLAEFDDLTASDAASIASVEEWLTSGGFEVRKLHANSD